MDTVGGWVDEVGDWVDTVDGWAVKELKIEDGCEKDGQIEGGAVEDITDGKAVDDETPEASYTERWGAGNVAQLFYVIYQYICFFLFYYNEVSISEADDCSLHVDYHYYLNLKKNYSLLH